MYIFIYIVDLFCRTLCIVACLCKCNICTSHLKLLLSFKEKQLIHDQLKISRQLTEQKVDEEESENEEEVEPTADFTLLKKTTENNDNPWLLGEVTQTNKGK